ncbi:MAG: hypothetical protein F6K54_29460 [Okeania sp. SIO3B5]|uniref:hypothetical protein n=1 Tax=Okeania sp. SIO3B5 TaxID=2607811 RepID=UPI0013FE9A79|nr:hypothetical protein [Okeania sp. SIO3B5]NEO56840.1 hypothetical protein [Okeania sp. SIO3B5]
MTRQSSDPSQNNSPRPGKGRSLAVIVTAITIIGGILGIITNTANIFDRFQGVFQKPETNTQTILDTVTKKAESAISKAKVALEKAQLETARDELQKAIQELENIPLNQGTENQIQTKKTEYIKIIYQIDQALEKKPCYELLYKIDDCQEYPFNNE